MNEPEEEKPMIRVPVLDLPRAWQGVTGLAQECHDEEAMQAWLRSLPQNPTFGYARQAREIFGLRSQIVESDLEVFWHRIKLAFHFHRYHSTMAHQELGTWLDYYRDIDEYAPIVAAAETIRPVPDLPDPVIDAMVKMHKRYGASMKARGSKGSENDSAS